MGPDELARLCTRTNACANRSPLVIAPPPKQVMDPDDLASALLSSSAAAASTSGLAGQLALIAGGPVPAPAHSFGAAPVAPPLYGGAAGATRLQLQAPILVPAAPATSGSAGSGQRPSGWGSPAASDMARMGLGSPPPTQPVLAPASAALAAWPAAPQVAAALQAAAAPVAQAAAGLAPLPPQAELLVIRFSLKVRPRGWVASRVVGWMDGCRPARLPAYAWGQHAHPHVRARCITTRTQPRPSCNLHLAPSPSLHSPSCRLDRAPLPITPAGPRPAPDQPPLHTPGASLLTTLQPGLAHACRSTGCTPTSCRPRCSTSCSRRCPPRPPCSPAPSDPAAPT